MVVDNNHGCLGISRPVRGYCAALWSSGAETFRTPAPCETCLRSDIFPVAQHSQYFQQYSCPLSGGMTSPGSGAVVFLFFFFFKEKLTRRGCGGSPAAHLLFCSICTCQLINCASRRFAQRRIWSAYQHRACGVGRE